MHRHSTSLTIAAAFFSVATLAGGALAQQAAPASAPPSVPGEWFKVCSEQGENNICNTQFTLVADTRQLITAMNLIEVSGKVNQKVVQAVVPTGRVIPAGVQVKIDDAAPVALNYSVCFQDRCIAEAELTDQIVASMKRGQRMTVTSINFQRQPNPVPVTLEGFTAAYDGEPKDASEIASRQRELNEALQQQAEERRQKFEAAQDAAKSGAGASEGDAPAQ
ncbi:invasion associated locus B family protein [Fulvimarina sp. 2208YS6-2-32]|uniref:Invasion associated locus B family protein n=1 Tax=Fulvimarina uroteuthidis TaxID=3098149 RepID=A0ABU5I7G9_9HYPH|nr:invasion associated locus B family protein [Fulvimarina sp. 2208YS6-2-32]MDY8110768.1 invasion associated locus B family protein [Fulvimarina sp. 2208YS6-2-32]